MASGVYNRGLERVLSGGWSLGGTGSFMVALVHTYTFNKDHASWPDISSTEVPNGSGYTSGGHTLTSPAVTQDDTNDWAKWDGADESWTSATFSADGAVVRNATDNIPLLFFSFTTTQIVNSGTFTIQWASDGLMTVAQA